MKLCRFELRATPGTVRSGLFHESRFYETDGERAIGIHEPGAVRLLTPVGLAPTLRVFEAAWHVHGGSSLSYEYMNPTTLVGPTAGHELPEGSAGLDFEIRIAGVVQDAGARIARDEAAGFLLGYSILVLLHDPDAVEAARLEGSPTIPSRDCGGYIGPFLVTPDELVDLIQEGDSTRFGWDVEATVNGEKVCATRYEQDAAFADMLVVASHAVPLRPGELVATPAVTKDRLDATPFGRLLLSGDEFRVTIEPLGTLVGRVE